LAAALALRSRGSLQTARRRPCAARYSPVQSALAPMETPSVQFSFTFVPSLSWQRNVFHTKMARKTASPQRSTSRTKEVPLIPALPGKAVRGSGSPASCASVGYRSTAAASALVCWPKPAGSPYRNDLVSACPYVCPEPVLVKSSFSAQKTVVSLPGRG
jgi:hypothetical protein